MKVSLSWLRELSGVPDVSPQQAARVLTMAGWNCEEVTLIDLSGILVGRVVSQEPHPSSRRALWIHQVDLGGETRQIIAGAANAVAGSLVPVALPGTTVPSGTYVRDARIAGVAGQGMLCSAAELKLSEDHDGILLLDQGRPGQRLDELIPSDAVLDVEVTPNRPDNLSHLGLARELAAAMGRKLPHDFMPQFVEGVDPPGTDLVQVRIDDPDLCRRYIGAVVTGVSVGPSPDWIQRRLRTCGVRPISNVVDVTNYVLLEYGQPLHAFDHDLIGGRQIVVRRAREGEELLCLDGEVRRLGPDVLVIADADRPVAIAGVIGGEETAVTEKTTNVLLEAANFDGVNVRATSRALRLRTEASIRFEKGISPELALAGARRAARLLAEVCGGQVHTDWADEYPRPQEPVRVSVRPEKVDSILGVHVPLQDMEAILERLGFQVRVDPDGVWDVLAPVFRLDVSIPEDIAEEVGRIYGADRIPATLPGGRRTTWTPARPSEERRLDPVRHLLAAAGFTEAVTPSLMGGEALRRLGVSERAMTVINPISDDQDTMRTSLIPSLLKAAALNQRHGRADVAMFEFGRVYLRRTSSQDGQPEEPRRLGIVRAGADGPEAARVAFLQLKGALERAASAVTPASFSYEPAAPPQFHPGRSAAVLAGGRPLGYAGELHPATVATLDVQGRAVAAEIDLEPLLELDVPRRARPLPRFPAVTRDLAVVVPASLPAGELQATIKGAGGDLLESCRAFDEYTGSQVPEGRKSVAFALTFRSPERTLTDAEVDAALDAVRRELRRRHGAEFRS